MKERMSDYALRGKLGGLRNAAKNDPREYTLKARQAAENRFSRLVDPHNELSEEERQRRAEAAKRAHMLELARKSAAARRK